MLFTMCFTSKRDAMGNSYKDIVNNFIDKKNIICMVPAGYDIDDFSDEFGFKYKENFSNTINNFFLRKLYLFIKIYIFIRDFESLRKIYKINKIFIYPDNRLIYPILSFFLSKMDIICWIHDPILHSGDKSIGKLNRWLNAKTLFKKVSRFIVSYERGKEELSYKYNISKEKIYTVYLPNMSSMEFNDIKEKKQEEKYDFIFFGRIEEYKGIDILIDTLKTYRELDNYRILIVGNGSKSEYVKNAIQDIKNIDFINAYVSDRDLAKYIMMSKYVILPYKDATGSQTVQIANYYGKMVLATKVGCFSEYIKEGQNGFLIDSLSCNNLKNAMISIDRTNYQAIKRIYHNFDIKKISRETYDIIQ